MRRTRLTLNTVQLDVRPVAQPQSAHIVLLTAKQQRLFSRASLPALPASPPHLTFRCFGWEDRGKFPEKQEGERPSKGKLLHWRSSEAILPMIRLKGKRRGVSRPV